MSATDGNALPVQNGYHIVRMDVINDERQYTRLLPGGSDDPHRRELRQPLRCV